MPLGAEARAPDGLIRNGGFGQSFPQRRRHLSVGHGVDTDRRRDRERAVSGRRSVRLKKEGDDVRVRLFAQASPVRGRHGGLHVADQFGGGARSPGIHEIAAGQRRSFVPASQVREVAARAVGLIRGQASAAWPRCTPAESGFGRRSRSEAIMARQEALGERDISVAHSIARGERGRVDDKKGTKDREQATPSTRRKRRVLDEYPSPTDE